LASRNCNRECSTLSIRITRDVIGKDMRVKDKDVFTYTYTLPMPISVLVRGVAADAIVRCTSEDPKDAFQHLYSSQLGARHANQIRDI